MTNDGTEPGLADAVDQRYARLTTKVFMTLEEAIGLSDALGQRIRGLSPPPDLVVGLANGGTLPAIVAARAAGLECRILRIRRKSSTLRQKFGPFGKLLRNFPAIGSIGRRLLKRAAALSASPFEFDEDREFGQIEIAGRHVVIVDDCIATGSSIALARSALIRRGAANVSTAVICWAANYESDKMHQVVPDIYQHRLMHFYPWSHNNAEYALWSDWLSRHGLDVWR